MTRYLSMPDQVPTLLAALAAAVLLAMCSDNVLAQTVTTTKVDGDRVTCWTWQGGHGSVGAYSQCDTATVVVHVTTPPPAPVVHQAPPPPPKEKPLKR